MKLTMENIYKVILDYIQNGRVVDIKEARKEGAKLVDENTDYETTGDGVALYRSIIWNKGLISK